MNYTGDKNNKIAGSKVRRSAKKKKHFFGSAFSFWNDVCPCGQVMPLR